MKSKRWTVTVIRYLMTWQPNKKILVNINTFIFVNIS